MHKLSGLLNVIVQLYTTLSNNFDLLTKLYLTCTTLDTLHLSFHYYSITSELDLVFKIY